MKEFLPESLSLLAQTIDVPLYVVGGSVRDFLLRLPLNKKTDLDLSSPCPEDEFVSCAVRCGFTVKAVYPNTGTVKIEDKDKRSFEYTRFRSDKYVRGEHRPQAIVFTDDIVSDAKRRDFCANAVYYDIKREEIVDPLGGAKDIENKVLRTVAPSVKVFGEDGLRLMRLARIAAQIGFMPDEECLQGAKTHCALIRDIAPERIFTELDLLLHADGKCNFKDGPYHGLKIMEETKVLNEILPELARGKGISQRADFHKYDVLEHSLRCVRYSAKSIRFAALLHDVGKPFCYFRDGDFHAHPEEGERIAREILGRLKAPKKLIEETAMLVRLHMRDYDLQMRESKVRRTLAEAYPVLDELLLLKQADYSACKDDLFPAPCVEKWRSVLETMKNEGAPLRLSDMKADGNDVIAAGVPPRRVGELLEALFFECVQDGSRNDREKLLKRIRTLAEI